MKDVYLTWKEPAEKWNDAVPLGNGFLGAMVYGHTAREKIQFNDDSLWDGTWQNRLNSKAFEKLPEVRRLILSGELKKAEEIMFRYMTASPCNMRAYVPLGELDIALNQCQPFQSSWMQESQYDTYSSSLNLMSGIMDVEHSQNGIHYRRETFISNPDQVFCYRLSSDRKAAICMDVLTERCRCVDVKVPDERRPGKFVRGGEWPGSKADSNRTVSPDTLLMTGHASDVEFAMGVRMVCDGICHDACSQLIAEGSSEVVLYVASATSNRYKDPIQAVIHKLDHAQQKGYEAIRKDHEKDFRSYMERCLLDVDGKPEAEQYFQFNRYLLVSGGREGSAALTLQGIWNAEFIPSWDSKYTININTQMNYWPVEKANLSELHLPLMELLEKMQEKGRQTAREMYGCRGMVCHHNTDFYGDCAPQDWYTAATFWPTGGAWLGLHIWDHYQYTHDTEFLRREYPILHDLALFFVDFLIEDQEGYLVTCPSLSPENRYILPDGFDTPICAGPTMDNQILRALFSICGQAADILGIRDENLKDFQECSKRLRTNRTGSKGQILEWTKEYPEVMPGMPHVSHLWAAYPGCEINWKETPELMDGVRKSLDIRIRNGAGKDGWPLAWQICLFARLYDPDMTDKLIDKMIRNSASRSLLNANGIFQIDGNFGALAGMLECLLQDHKGMVLLPALPSSWKKGRILGIRGRNGITADISWQDGKLEEAVIRTDIPQKITLCGQPYRILQEGSQVHTETLEDGTRFYMEARKAYRVLPA